MNEVVIKSVQEYRLFSKTKMNISGSKEYVLKNARSSTSVLCGPKLGVIFCLLCHGISASGHTYSPFSSSPISADNAERGKLQRPRNEPMLRNDTGWGGVPPSSPAEVAQSLRSGGGGDTMVKSRPSGNQDQNFQGFPSEGFMYSWSSPGSSSSSSPAPYTAVPLSPPDAQSRHGPTQHPPQLRLQPRRPPAAHQPRGGRQAPVAPAPPSSSSSLPSLHSPPQQQQQQHSRLRQVPARRRRRGVGAIGWRWRWPRWLRAVAAPFTEGFRFKGFGFGFVKPVLSSVVGFGLRVPLTQHFEGWVKRGYLPAVSSFWGVYGTPLRVAGWLSFSYPTDHIQRCFDRCRQGLVRAFLRRPQGQKPQALEVTYLQKMLAAALVPPSFYSRRGEQEQEQEEEKEPSQSPGSSSSSSRSARRHGLVHVYASPGADAHGTNKLDQLERRDRVYRAGLSLGLSWTAEGGFEWFAMPWAMAMPAFRTLTHVMGHMCNMFLAAMLSLLGMSHYNSHLHHHGHHHLAHQHQHQHQHQQSLPPRYQEHQHQHQHQHQRAGALCSCDTWTLLRLRSYLQSKTSALKFDFCYTTRAGGMFSPALMFDLMPFFACREHLHMGTSSQKPEGAVQQTPLSQQAVSLDEVMLPGEKAAAPLPSYLHQPERQMHIPRHSLAKSDQVCDEVCGPRS